MIVCIRTHRESTDSKMMVTKDANMITILMGLIIMKANKKFQSNRLLRIFGSSNTILKTFVKYMNQLGMSKSGEC